MVFVDLDGDLCRDLAAHLQTEGILISPGQPLRLVTHLDISSRDVATVIKTVGNFLRQRRRTATQRRKERTTA